MAAYAIAVSSPSQEWVGIKHTHAATLQDVEPFLRRLLLRLTLDNVL